MFSVEIRKCFIILKPCFSNLAVKNRFQQLKKIEFNILYQYELVVKYIHHTKKREEHINLAMGN